MKWSNKQIFDLGLPGGCEPTQVYFPSVWMHNWSRPTQLPGECLFQFLDLQRDGYSGKKGHIEAIKTVSPYQKNKINTTFLENFKKLGHHQRYRVQRYEVDLALFSSYLEFWSFLINADWTLGCYFLFSGSESDRHMAYLLCTWALFYFWSTVMLVFFLSSPMHSYCLFQNLSIIDMCLVHKQLPQHLNLLCCLNLTSPTIKFVTK